MLAGSNVLGRLDAETRVHHREADAPWLRLLEIDVTGSSYVEFLVAMYGFEAPIEAALALTARVGTIVQLRERARSGLIVQDLLMLGLTPSRIARLPQCSKIIPFRDPTEALGWMYVVERATLLHDAIRRHLEVRIPHSAPCAYLSAYAGVESSRWRQFGAALDSVAQTPKHVDQIVAGARGAFACHRDWFRTQPVRATDRA